MRALLGAVAVGVFGASMAVSGPTHAALPSSGENQKHERLSLTNSERRGLAVTHVERKAIGEVPGPVGSATRLTGTACRSAWEQIWMKNVTGANIFTYKTTVTWCYSGGKVQSVSPAQIYGYVYGWAAALGWSYEGVRSNSQWDYYGDRWVYRTYTQGAFRYCPPRIICIQSKYPYAYVDTYGNGNSSSTGGV